MDAALFQAIFLLIQSRYVTMATLMPLKIKKVVPAFPLQHFGKYFYTRNSTPIHGHPACALVLTTYMAKPLNDKQTEVEYVWEVATAKGGIPPERLYAATEDHNLLPGMNSEQE